jgi:hypothetical protein
MGGFRDGVLMRRRRKEREGGERGRRERERGVYGFSSLLKQNKKAKICFVIYIAGFFFKKNFCYEVFAKQKKTEESSNYYSERVFFRMRHSHTKLGQRQTRDRRRRAL